MVPQGAPLMCTLAPGGDQVLGCVVYISCDFVLVCNVALMNDMCFVCRVQNSLSRLHVADRGSAAFSTESRGSTS